MNASIKQNTRITAKNIQYFAAGSQETLCFVCALYLDGKKIGTAENDGHGGCTFVRYNSSTIREQVLAFIATLDPVTSNLGDDTHTITVTEEWLVDSLIEDWLVERDLKKMMSARIVFTKQTERGIYQSTKIADKAQMARILAKPESVKAKLGAFAILNLLPFSEAVALFRVAA